MAKSVPDKTARDANLDALRTAVDEWVDKEVTRLDNEVAFMRDVIKGRGAKEASMKNLTAATKVAVSDIQAFLTGE